MHDREAVYLASVWQCQFPDAPVDAGDTATEREGSLRCVAPEQRDRLEVRELGKLSQDTLDAMLHLSRGGLIPLREHGLVDVPEEHHIGVESRALEVVPR